MSRKPDPTTPYHVRDNYDKGYHYAYVQRVVETDKGPVRRKINIGTLKEQNVFVPNNTLRLMNVEERRLLIFPEDWDITLVTSLDQKQTKKETIDSDVDKGAVPQSNEAKKPSVPLDVAVPQHYHCKIYGDFWFCEQILRLKHVREDLLSVFDGDISMVDDITTMAIYPLLSGKSYNMLSSWQAYHHTASSHALEPSYITKLTQKIIDGNRMDLSRLRIKRQSPGTYGCIDSATRSGYIRPTHIANVRRYGDNKDGIDLPCTSDVVVYSLETHEPVYYRSFPESQLDMATVRTILTELNLFGICNVVMMTCRGYCSVANIGSFLAEGIPFLTAAKVQQMPVFPCLSRVEYDKNGLPSNMNYDPETKLYVLQVGAEPFMVPLPEGRTVKAENVKVNLYLDVERRAKELNMFKLDIQTEEQKINMIKSGERAMPDTVAFNKEFKWFIAMKPKKGGHDQAGNPKHTAMPEILEHVKAREKAERIAGFFASVQWGLENTAEKSLHDDRLRDEQEKYFYEFKDVYHADMQDCWTEGSRTGRDFICFVGLMIYSWVKHMWSTAGLKEDYRSTELLLDSMAPIHFSTYPDGTPHMENFNNRQITLCGKFKITPPSECMTEAQKEDWQRAYPPKGARMT